MKRTLIIAAVIMSMVAFTLPASAGPIDAYINGPWLEFGFGGAGTFAISGFGFVPSTSGNSVFLDQPAWTFTLAEPTEFRITDAFQTGDIFTVLDSGTSILTTSTPVAGGYCSDDPELCFGVGGVSYGSITLLSGLHTLTIQIDASPYDGGAAYFRVGVPEPLSLILLGFGLLGLGAIRRSRG